MGSEKILDIGIGTGGGYILKDQPGTLRIGLDIRSFACALGKEKYSIPFLEADADTRSGIRLPFAKKSITSVDIILPHDELLAAMIDPASGFWPEIKRVTKKQVRVVVDMTYFHRQGIYDHDQQVILEYPHHQIETALTDCHFRIREFRELSPSEVASLETDFSENIASWMQQPLGAKVFQIVASVK